MSANGGVNPFQIGKNDDADSLGAGRRNAYNGRPTARHAPYPSPASQAPEPPLPMPMDAAVDAGVYTSFAGYPGDGGSAPAATVAEPFPDGIPGFPMPAAPVSRPDWPQPQAERPDWLQAEPPSSVTVRGIRARKPRIHRPGSEGIGSRSTMTMMYRDAAQARGVDGSDGKPVTDVAYEFQQPQLPASQASAAQPGAPGADSPVFDSLDEFVDLSKPSKFKAGRGKKNMLVGHSRTKAAAKLARFAKPTKPSKSAKPAKPAKPARPGRPVASVAAYGYNAPTVGAGMATAVKMFYKKYARFAGRASRSEYWWAVLFMSVVSSVLSFVPVVGPMLLPVFALANLVPGLALMWRRAHDADKPWLPWLCVGSSALSAILSPFVLAFILIPGLAPGMVGMVDGRLTTVLVLADLLSILLTLALSVTLGLLPSKQSGSRFDKR